MSQTILCDEGGSPLINGQGNLILASGNILVLQAITRILSTTRGTEILDPDYGMGYLSLGLIGDNSTKIMTIRQMVIDAIDPDKIPGLKNVSNIDVSILLDTAYISIYFNDTEQLEITLNVD